MMLTQRIQMDHALMLMRVTTVMATASTMPTATEYATSLNLAVARMIQRATTMLMQRMMTVLAPMLRPAMTATATAS